MPDTAQTTTEPPPPFDLGDYILMQVGASRQMRGACLWCGELVRPFDRRGDALCSACRALREEATR